MIKNLIYGTLAAGSVAAVVVTAVVTSAGKPDQAHEISFNANGGTFDAKATCWTNEVNLADCMSNVLNDVERYLAYPNHDLLGWTNTVGKEVYGYESVTNYTNTTLFAKWKLSDIQRYEVTNGIFNVNVEKFPVVFTGKASWRHPIHRILFRTPQGTNDCFRISLDPPTTNATRVCASLYVTNLTTRTGLEKVKFGESTSCPVNFGEDLKRYFSETNEYELTIDFGIMGAGEAYYALGIGLEGVQVKFEPIDGCGYLSDRRYWSEGVNYSLKYFPYGFLPKPTGVSATFDAWYTSEDMSGTKVDATMIPNTNKWLYAHWKFSSDSKYYVAFNAREGKGEMSPQEFRFDVPQNLARNTFYKDGHQFMGWARSQERSILEYVDYANCALVTNNLCAKPGETNVLHAVWQKMSGGGTNYFAVAATSKTAVTNFWTDIVTPGAPVYFDSTGNPKSLPFQLNATNMTNSVNCRVAIDPLDGYARKTNIVLTVERLENDRGTNKWNVAVANVTEFPLATRSYKFTNGVYRFSVKGATTNDAYLVSLGATGAKVTFEPYVRSAETYDWTVDSPFGYLPKLTASPTYGNFLGWYDSAGNAIDETAGVIGPETVYARWENSPYYVAFDGQGASGKMDPQQFFRDKPQNLKPNQFCLTEHQFAGWATVRGSTNVVFRDGALVTNLCDTAGGTNTLYAVWTLTPGVNWVIAGNTNFSQIAVSPSSPKFFAGSSSEAKIFTMTVPNEAKQCRVSIDPQEADRKGAKLTVDRAVRTVMTNGTVVVGAWSNVCEVTDLAASEVKCNFTTNFWYRFSVSAATTYNYIVGIGAPGAQYTFEPCGGSVATNALSSSLTFNWTVDTRVGYLPPLTNTPEFGTNTWHYSPDVTVTNYVLKTDVVTNVPTTCYAHWSKGKIWHLVFDWRLGACGMAANTVLTNYFGQGTKVNIYDSKFVKQPTCDNHGFLGWTTNAAGTLGWEITTFSISNNASFYAQWTDKWKTSRVDAGLSVDGYFGTIPSAFVIPATIDNCPVEVIAIGSSAFTNKSEIVTLDLPSTLATIGSSAFAGCSSLRSVSLKAALKTIGGSAFSRCSALETLAIPAGVTYVGDSAFEDCTSLTTVTFPSVEMPAESTKIGDGGFLDGIFEDYSPSVELGTCLFKGCTSLKDVKLPLGVNCIPDECFSGCTAMTSFHDMPYTVIEIGTEAFCGCTHLTNVVCTEIVNEIGEDAFKKCARLKFLSFIGGRPASVGDDIFKGTPRNVLVRYLPNMCGTANSYTGGNWPSLPSLWPEASASNTSRRLTWLGGTYPRRKVIFNYNNNATLWKSDQEVALYHSGRVFGLLAPRAGAADDEGGETSFTGWYTQPMGGRKVSDYWVVPTASDGNSAPITVYAHFGNDEEEGAEMGSRSYEVYFGRDKYTDGLEDFPGFYSVENEETGAEGDDMFYYAASTFNGIVIDGTDIDSCTITGTVEFVFQGGSSPADGGMQSPFTATVTWNSGKKITLTGVADAEGYLVAKGSRWSLGEAGDAHRTVITKSGINGWLSNGESEFRIYAARNRTAQANEGAAKTVVQMGLQATKGTWHVVLENSDPDPAEGHEGSVDFQGYSTLSITIANMGQATVTGTLGDGTKVSQSATLIIGDGCCCLPVIVRPYGGKGGLAFMLWFTWKSDGSFGEDEASVKGLTGWTAPTFTASLAPAQPLTFIDEKRYTGSKECTARDEYLATITMNGKTWSIPSGDENPGKLKLTYDYKTGIFTGSCVLDPDGEKKSASVNGVFVDRIETDDEGAAVSEVYQGYGTAVIKGEGSYKVLIGNEP